MGNCGSRAKIASHAPRSFLIMVLTPAGSQRAKEICGDDVDCANCIVADKIYRIPVPVLQDGPDVTTDWVEWMSPYYEPAVCFESEWLPT